MSAVTLSVLWQEREWVRVVGHRDVPGRPAMFATTRQFLDYFNLQNLNELPPLSEIRDLEEMAKQLGLPPEQGTLDVEQPEGEHEGGNASEIHEVIEVEEQSAEELFAELDEMEADLPDNFDDMIKKQKVEALNLTDGSTTATDTPEDSAENTPSDNDSGSKTSEDSV